MNPKPGYAYETPTNQLDMSHQSFEMNQEPPPQPPSKKSLLEEAKSQPYPFLYGPEVSQKEVSMCQILFPQFRVKSFNFLAIISLAIYFIASYIYFLTSNKQLIGCTLLKLGAKFSPKIKFQGHVHRLIVSIVLFGSLLHVIVILLTMMMFGFMAEKYIGVKKLCFILFASGFLGNLLSAVIYPYYVTTGSSGMAFGLLMLHFSFLYKNYSKLGFAKNQIIALFTLMVIANFITMIDTKAVDIAVILGGIIAGVLISFYYLELPERSDKFRKIQYLALLLFIIITILLIVLLFTNQIDNVEVEKWCD